MEHILSILQSGHLEQMSLKDQYHLRLLSYKLSTTTLSKLPSESLLYLIEGGWINMRQWEQIWELILDRHPSIPPNYFKLPYLSNNQIEQLVRIHRCHDVDSLCQTSDRRLTFSNLSHPFEYPNWCEHCRNLLLPYDQCIRSNGEFQLAIKIICDDHYIFMEEGDLFFKSMIEHSLHYSDEQSLSHLYGMARYWRLLLKYQHLLPKIDFVEYCDFYNPKIHCLFHFKPEKITWSNLYRHPHLLTETNEQYWQIHSFYRFLYQCFKFCNPLLHSRDDYLEIMYQHLPQIIWRDPKIFAKWPNVATIKRMKKSLTECLLTGMNQIDCPLSVIHGDRYILQNILEYVWKSETDSHVRCTCGHSAPKLCPNQKCGMCCSCHNHRRK